MVKQLIAFDRAWMKIPNPKKIRFEDLSLSNTVCPRIPVKFSAILRFKKSDEH